MFHNVIVAIYIGVGIWEDSFSNMRGQCLEYVLEFSRFFLLVTVCWLLEINRLPEELAQLLTKEVAMAKVSLVQQHPQTF